MLEKYIYCLSSSSSGYTSPKSPSFYSNSMMLQTTNKKVFGVILVDDRISIDINNIHRSDYLILGSIIVDKETYTCEDVRKLITEQINMLPKNFGFISREGWPLDQIQESKLKLGNISSERNTIAIRKLYATFTEKPRIGIKIESIGCIGSVFVELNKAVRESRSIIDSFLRDIIGKTIDYQFIDRNGWPVPSTQEEQLEIMELIVNQFILIRTRINSNNNQISAPLQNNLPIVQFPEITYEQTQISLPNPQENYVSSNKTSQIPIGDDILDNWKRRSKKIIKRPTFTRKNKNWENKSKKKPKHIMISYSRQEAFQHALDLKAELVSYGFSVYLDVDEIKNGSDWQDALNYAVKNCEVFIPLITTMYGKTQWTNREVKLADILHKFIVPINFLDTWPPECLAIQFATTQYIPWRPQEKEIEKEKDECLDIKVWPKHFIKRVGKMIADLIPRTNQAGDSVCLESCDKSLIVISSHPNQTPLVYEIKRYLTDNDFQVWTSIDLLEEQPEAAKFLPTIQEECKRPLSLPIEQVTEQRKRILNRQMSNISNMSRTSSINLDEVEKLKTFQDKVQIAGAVIVIASKAYFNSKTSFKHVYYCEHRKAMILVKSDDYAIPSWFKMLCSNQLAPLKTSDEKFLENLIGRIKLILDPLSKRDDREQQESKIFYLINYMKKNLDKILDTCVYVVGSTEITNTRTELICKAIGKELAKLTNVTIVTSGFKGVGDVLARTFYDQKQKCSRLQNNLKSSVCKFRSSVVHILPFKDTEDFRDRCKQLDDGTFGPLEYGKTIFLGESMQERETAVARLLNTCILIGGGPHAAHEAQELAWNDHYVIPVVSTGGAASGEFGVPQQIFERPVGVSFNDWKKLEEPNAAPEEVAKAMVNIIVTVKNSIATQYLQSQVNVSKSKGRTRSIKIKNEKSDIYSTVKVKSTISDRKTACIKTNVESSTWKKMKNRLKLF